MSEDPPAEGPDIARLSGRVVYENRWMRIHEDEVRFRDGRQGIYGVVEKQDFVVVVPVEPDGRVHLVQQWRYPVGGRWWEFCQGIAGPPGGDPAAAAAQELREECGLAAARLTQAGRLLCAPGTMRQAYGVFLATGLTRVAAAPEMEEQDLVSRAVPRAELERMIRDGEIQDNVTVSAWALLRLKGLL